MTHGNRHADGAASSASKRALQSSGIFSTQNTLDDCLFCLNCAHPLPLMNLHLQPQESFFRRHCRHPAFLFNACGAASGADSSVMPNE